MGSIREIYQSHGSYGYVYEKNRSLHVEVNVYKVYSV